MDKARKKKVVSSTSGEFNLRCLMEKLPEYDPLHDRNLQHFFEQKQVQTHLHRNGLIDGNGRVINLKKNQSKLHIIEQEYRIAERQEQLRRKDEEEMRHRVQQKRFETLEKIRIKERLMKIKEDRQIRQEIMKASASALNIPPAPSRKSRAKKVLQSAAESSEQSFFVTEKLG